jgi:hypothetical protein
LVKRRRAADGENWRKEVALFCRGALSEAFLTVGQTGRTVEKRVGNLYTAPFIALRLVRAFRFCRATAFVEGERRKCETLKKQTLATAAGKPDF